MESFSVQAVLSAVDKNFSKTFASATKAADSFGNNTTKSTGLGGKGMIKFGAVAGAATAVVSKALSVVTSHVGNAVDRFDTLNKYPVVMKALGYSTQDTGKSMKLLSNGIDGLPTTLNDITSAAQQFAPLTGSATSGAKAALALNDAFLASGASVADTSRGMQQYTQMLATGKVDMQSWRTLQETMPIALRKTANAFGFTGKSAEQDLFKALQSGQITIDDLNKKFVELDKGQNGFSTLARKNSVGIKTSFTNLGTAVTKGLAGTLTAIDNGLKNAKLGGIADLINSMKGGINTAFDAINSTITTYIPVIVNTIKTLFDFVKSNASWITPLVISIGTFVAAMKTMMTIISIVSAVGKAYTALKTAMVIGQAVAGVISGSQAAASALTFMAGESKLAALALKLLGGAFPGMIIIAAITAVVAALVWFFTQTKTGQAIWQGFMTFLSSAWTAMSSFLIGIWNTLGSVFSTIWQALVPVIQNLVSMLQSIWTGYVTAATAVWNGLVSIASGVWNLLKSVILGPILLLIDLLTGNWSQMKKDAVMIWNNIKSSLGQIVSGIVTAVSGYFKGLGQMLSGIWNSVKGAASSIWGAIRSVLTNLANSAINGVKNAWSGIRGWASNIWNGVKSAIRAAMNFDLGAAGRAIMDSFFSGLVSAWGKVKSFVGGIASWIRQHKGPISYDRKLLIPAGNAIMTGLNAGLVEQFKTVQNNVSNMAGAIANTASNALNSNVQALNANISGSYSGSLKMQDSSLQMQNNSLLRTIANKSSDIYLDGNTLVGGTANRMDNALGNNTRLRGRLS